VIGMANTLLDKVSTDAALEMAVLQRHERRDWFPFFLSLPALLVVFLIIGVPLVYSVVLSLHRINILTHQWIFVGLDNYLQILPQAEFISALERTAYFAAITVAVGLVLGVAMALVLNMNFPGRGLLRGVVLIPWAMAPVGVAVDPDLDHDQLDYGL
jgi:ABC-type sugar transport system permease subunit